MNYTKQVQVLSLICDLFLRRCSQTLSAVILDHMSYDSLHHNSDSVSHLGPNSHNLQLCLKMGHNELPDDKMYWLIDWLNDWSIDWLKHFKKQCSAVHFQKGNKHELCLSLFFLKHLLSSTCHANCIHFHYMTTASVFYSPLVSGIASEQQGLLCS